MYIDETSTRHRLPRVCGHRRTEATHLNGASWRRALLIAAVRVVRLRGVWRFRAGAGMAAQLLSTPLSCTPFTAARRVALKEGAGEGAEKLCRQAGPSAKSPDPTLAAPPLRRHGGAACLSSKCVRLRSRRRSQGQGRLIGQGTKSIGNRLKTTPTS